MCPRVFADVCNCHKMRHHCNSSATIKILHSLPHSEKYKPRLRAWESQWVTKNNIVSAVVSLVFWFVLWFCAAEQRFAVCTVVEWHVVHLSAAFFI